MTSLQPGGPTPPSARTPVPLDSIPRWHRRFVLLAGGGFLAVLGSLGLVHLVHSPGGAELQARLGVSGGSLQAAAALLTGVVSFILILIGYRYLRRITAALRVHEENLAALHASEARTAAILASSLDCIISMDHTGRIIEFNPAAERVFGHAREQVLGRELAEVVVPPALRESHRKGLARYLATGVSTVLSNRIEVVALRADGTEFPAELAVTPIRVDNGITFTAYLRDLTEVKRTQEILRRQALAFANISDGVILTSLDGKILDCNLAAERMFGYTKEELLGKPPSILYKPEQSGILTTQLVAGIRRDGRWAGEIPFRRKDGSEGLCATVVVPLCDEQGQRLATIRVKRDITEQEQAGQRQAAQHAVAKVLAESGTAVDAIPDLLQALCEPLKWPVAVYWTVDPSSRFLQATHFWHPPHLPVGELCAACRDTPLGPGVGLAGRVWCSGEISWAEDLAREDSHRYTSQALGLGLRGCFAVPVFLGEEVHGVLTCYTWQGRPPHDELLKTLTAVGTQFGQFLERCRADEALKMQAAVLENMAEGVLVADETGQISFTNSAFDAIFGYARGQLAGQNVGVLNQLPPEENSRLVSDILQDLKTRGVWSGEFRNCKQDGTPIFTRARISALELGGKAYSVSVQEDVTERKRAEGELQRAKEAAEEANRLKSEFLANMSHEIRTPLNGILGMTELALDTELTREQWEYLDMVKGSADALLSVINDILDFSKIEAGKLDLEPIEFRLRDTVEETVRPLGLRAHKKGLELACQITPVVPDHLVGDTGRLRQILVNLVGNALKFTEQGEVVVHADVEAATHEHALLHFTVRDTGVGIPREKQHLIFDAFAQADGSTTRQFGGTGLGLAISSQLVRMMGGKIWVESEPGLGSAFHFTARFAIQQDRLNPTLPRHLLKLWDRPVLVVDDNATTRHILEKMLTNWRMVPTTARDGPTALQLLQHAQTKGTPFPLVLLDAQMPGMDGFTVAERIEQQRGLAGAVVMMLTADGLAGNASRFDTLGIASYVMKPIQQAELFEAILTALRVSTCDGRRPALLPREPVGGGRAALNILLAEDHPVNQRLAVRLLEKRGHRVVVANNGKEALEKLQIADCGLQKEQGSSAICNPQSAIHFDLVLMDVQMPEMGGFEAVGQIRAQEAEGRSFRARGGRLPIIALTAHAMKGDRERCLEAGMDGYVTKPIKPAALENAIREVLAPEPACT